MADYIEKKRMSDRFIVKIVLKHKQTIIDSDIDKQRMQDDINAIISDFVQKTGRKIESIKTEKIDGKYRLFLEIG